MARTARGAARALPSARNILEVIGVRPDEPQDFLSSQSGREAKFARAKKEKKPVCFGTGNRCISDESTCFFLFFVFCAPPSPPLALEILVHLGSRVGGFEGI